MGKIMICPSCKEEVEVTRIRVSDRLSYKYMTFAKAVGVCPKCFSEIHIEEIDDVVKGLQEINKEYNNILKEYDDGSTVIPKDFSKDWGVISEDDLIFETTEVPGFTDIDMIITLDWLLYNGSLKNEYGYDISPLNTKYINKLDELMHYVLNEDGEGSETYSYQFKTHCMVNGEIREVCCMMWKDLNDGVSGIIFNTDDNTSYRYGKQKTKDKYVIV
jgi:hypothetical protein